MSPPRKLHIKSYGCQMNVYDAQRMVDTLAPEGFVETASVDDADLVILNTCHIREKASEKVYSELGRLRVAQGRGRAKWPPDEHRGGRLRRAGGRRRDHPPRARRRCRGRPAKLSSSAAAIGAGQEPRPRAGDRISGRGQVRLPAAAEARLRSARAASHRSSPCRKAATSFARSAWCPIRAARKYRVRSPKSSMTCCDWPTTACAKSP